MKFDVTVHIHSHSDADPTIVQLLERIMATDQETLDELQALSDQVAKIGTETTASLTKITELEALIASNPRGVPAAVTAKIAELKAQLTGVDNLVTDVVVTPPDIDDGGAGGTEVPRP